MDRPVDITQGRRFGCTMCGNCCERPGLVYMSKVEVQRIAEYLEISERTFRRRHDIRWDASARNYVLDAQDGGCPLLSEGRRCEVHPVKPLQCSTFPFWPEMLDSQTEWESSKSFCPGLDAPQGRRYSRRRILEFREAMESADEGKTPLDEHRTDV